MAVAYDAARGVLESVRALWRGTRGRAWVPPESVAGYLFDVGGVQRGLGELRTLVASEVAAAELEPLDQYLVGAFYGLVGYPVDLAEGVAAIVGSVPDRRGRAAGRSTVAARRREAVAQIADAMAGRPGEVPGPLVPQVDPVAAEQSTGVLAVHRPDRDRFVRLVHRIGCDLLLARPGPVGVRLALDRWARDHGVVVNGDAAVGGRLRAEHRNAARSLVSVATFEIGASPELQAAVRDPDNWVLASVDLRPAGWVRGAVVDRLGFVSPPVGFEELVFAMQQVHERRDPLGEIAGLVLDQLRDGGAAEVLDEASLATVVWGLGYGLGAAGSWQVYELARWHVAQRRRDRNRVSLLAWSAHVVSEFGYDDLALRLVALAEAALRDEADGAVTRDRLEGAGHLIALVRSGCRYREAERRRQVGDLAGASVSVTVGLKDLEQARTAWRNARGDRHVVGSMGGIALPLRLAELHLCAAALQRDGVSVAVRRPLQVARRVLEQARVIHQAHGDPGADVDVAILADRLVGLEARLAELDDSAPG